MKKWFLVPALCSLLLFGCTSKQAQPGAEVKRNVSKTPTTQILERGQTPDLADGKETDVRDPHPLSLADLAKKYPSTIIFRGPSTKRQVALTFDDAPDGVFTPQVLDVLKKNNVNATFFVIGNRAEQHPEIVKRIIQEGHVVGNHSYNHANLPRLSDENFHDQIQRTDEILHRLTGYYPKLVRPPYGAINEGQISWLASQGFKVINWNVDSLDWKGLKADQVSTNVLTHILPGSIVLQHAAGGTGEDLTGSVQALSRIIAKLRSDGVEIVTVPELLRIPKNK